MNDLADRMKDAAPTPPDLSGLAARAEYAARGDRRRRRRIGAACALAVLVVAGVVVLPRLIDDDRGPDLAEGADCVSSPTAPASAITTQDATWVRFCELADEGRAQRARYPRGVITGGLATSMVDGWADWATERRACDERDAVLRSRQFRIEIGLADGEVAELTGDTGCSTDDELLFTSLESALLISAASAHGGAPVVPEPVVCPTRFTTTETNTDGISADELTETATIPQLSTVPLIPWRAIAVDVCAYSGTGRQRDLVDQWQVRNPMATSIRTAATIGYSDGVADCQLFPDALSYLVVLHDVSGTARTISLDPTVCGAMSAAIGTPAEEAYLGLASPELVDLVADSSP